MLALVFGVVLQKVCVQYVRAQSPTNAIALGTGDGVCMQGSADAARSIDVDGGSCTDRACPRTSLPRCVRRTVC